MPESALGIIGKATSRFLERLVHIFAAVGALLVKLISVVDVNDDDGQPEVQFRLDQVDDSSIALLDRSFSLSTDRLIRTRLKTMATRSGAT